MLQHNTVLSTHVPKWGQYPVGVFPGCNTKKNKNTLEWLGLMDEGGNEPGGSLKGSHNSGL